MALPDNWVSDDDLLKEATKDKSPILWKPPSFTGPYQFPNNRAQTSCRTVSTVIALPYCTEDFTGVLNRNSEDGCQPAFLEGWVCVKIWVPPQIVAFLVVFLQTNPKKDTPKTQTYAQGVTQRGNRRPQAKAMRTAKAHYSRHSAAVKQNFAMRRDCRPLTVPPLVLTVAWVTLG